MAAGELYLKSGQTSLFYRDGSDTERSLPGSYTTVQPGASSSLPTPLGAGHLVLGRFGTPPDAGLRKLCIAWYTGSTWRIGGVLTLTDITVKPTGSIRVSGNNLQVFWNNTWYILSNNV